MTTVRRIRQLAYSTIPLGGLMLLLAVLVGDPVDIGISVLTVILGVALSLYVRHLPAERVGNMEPTVGSAAIRTFTMAGLFALVAFVVSGFSAAEFAALARRPSVVVAVSEIALGGFVGITFPHVIDRVAHHRAVHTVENVLVVGLFAGLFGAHQGSGLLFGGAYLVARSGLQVYNLHIREWL